jgi:hypothetical protein
LSATGYDDDLRHVPHPRRRSPASSCGNGNGIACPPLRVALEAATLYFCIAVLVSIFFNLLATTMLDRIL